MIHKRGFMKQPSKQLFDYKSFFAKHKTGVSRLDSRFRDYVVHLSKRNTPEDIARSISFVDKINGIDMNLFHRLLSSACAYRLKIEADPDWLSRRTKQVRKNLKAISERHRKIKRDLTNAIEYVSEEVGRGNPSRFDLSSKDLPVLLQLLEKVRRSSFFSKRVVPYERGFLNLHLEPSTALLVYVLDTAPDSGISNHLLRSLGSFYRIWEFENLHPSDGDELDIGVRLRQRYRPYSDKYVFTATKQGYQIV